MTCRSSATRKAYVRCLDHFMKYLKIDTYDKLLDKDPKIIQMNICDFILFMRKNRSYAMVSLYVGAINKFYAMNVYNTARLETVIQQDCCSEIAKDSDIKLLVVDSVTGLYRAEYGDRSMLSQ
jgi:Rad51